MDQVQNLTLHTLNSVEGLGDMTAEIMRYSNQFRTNCMGFVSLTILLWDHVATFSDEVKYVWGGSGGAFKYLFLLNRYLTPLGFSVNIFAYLSPVLSNATQGESAKRCADFIRFEGSMTVIGINVVAIMMFYRVYVLYWFRQWSSFGRCYVYILAVTLLLELTVNAWLLTKGGPVPDSLGCEMIFVDVSPAMASSSAWLPLLFDTLAFILIFRVSYKNATPENAVVLGRFNLHRQFLKDGVLYYCPILAVTLSLSLMIAFSRPGSQNLIAQLELIITVTMMSRITINLKKSYRKTGDIDTQLASMQSPVTAFVGHACAQISSVLDVTRSRAQNEHHSDVEMVTWNRNVNFAVDSDSERGGSGSQNCVV